jgi:hypothetical protein
VVDAIFEREKREVLLVLGRVVAITPYGVIQPPAAKDADPVCKGYEVAFGDEDFEVVLACPHGALYAPYPIDKAIIVGS